MDGMRGILVVGGLQRDLDRALGRVDAGPDHLALRPGDLPGPQVADLAGAQAADAGVADAHATAERERGARLLAGHEDRLRAVAGRLDAGLREADRAALAELRVALAD